MMLKCRLQKIFLNKICKSEIMSMSLTFVHSTLVPSFRLLDIFSKLYVLGQVNWFTSYRPSKIRKQTRLLCEVPAIANQIFPERVAKNKDKKDLIFDNSRKWTKTSKVCDSTTSELVMGLVQPQVGSGDSGRVGSGRVQLCGFVWVTLDDTGWYTKRNRIVHI